MTNKEKSGLQRKIVNSLDKDPHGRLLLAPRTGKTRLAILLIKKNKPKKILWVSPSRELIEKDIPSEFVKWRAKKYLKNTHLTTWASLYKEKGKYDMIILDEEHYITERNSINLRNGSLSGNIISMTGTPTKHKDKKMIYDELGLPVLYSLDINEAVDIGMLSNYEIDVISIPLSRKNDILVKMRNGGSFKTSEYKKYQWLSKKVAQSNNRFLVYSRMRFIKNVESKQNTAKNLLKSIKGRTLIFTGSIKQAESLCKHTYHSKTDDTDLKKFQKGDIDRISMVNSGGTGFTYKELDNLVLVQADSDKNGMTSQKICRILMKQKNHKANIWILCLHETRDKVWVEKTLEKFDKNKITWK